MNKKMKKLFCMPDFITNCVLKEKRKIGPIYCVGRGVTNKHDVQQYENLFFFKKRDSNHSVSVIVISHRG